jgi:hypothetical protein
VDVGTGTLGDPSQLCVKGTCGWRRSFILRLSRGLP